MLKRLFIEFDKKCFEFNCFKLYTIGDCYVAFGFTNKEKRDPIMEVENIVSLAKSMIKIIH